MRRLCILAFACVMAFAVAGCGNPAQEKIEEGAFFYNQGEFNLAAQTFKEAAELAPENASAHNNHGLALHSARKFEEALPAFEKALALYEQEHNKATVLNNMGFAFSELGQKDQAIEHFEKALAMDGNNAAVHVNLGTMYWERDNYEKAVELTNRGIELSPATSAGYINLVEIHFDSRNWEALLKDFDRLTKNFPQAGPRFLSKAGFAHLELGNYDPAAQFFSQSLNMGRNEGAAHAGLALVHAYAGGQGEGAEKALAEIESAERVAPELFVVHRNKGLVMEALGRPDDARAAWQDALEISPEHEEVKGFIANLDAGKSNLPEGVTPAAAPVMVGPSDEAPAEAPVEAPAGE